LAVCVYGFGSKLFQVNAGRDDFILQRVLVFIANMNILYLYLNVIDYCVLYAFG
jgi:hypothetical protein